MRTASLTTAAGMLMAPLALAANVIDQGTGFGTYYYDVEDRKACFNDFNNIDGGYVECSLSPLTLDNIGSNNLVAMDHLKLAANPSKYCGKQVVVSVNGVASSIPFFIGDGCERCGLGFPGQTTWNSVGAPGLDFSFSQLSALSRNACFAGHVDISWQILDTDIYDFAARKFAQSGSAPKATSTSTAAKTTAKPTSQPTVAPIIDLTSLPVPVETIGQKLPAPPVVGTASLSSSVQTATQTVAPTTLETAVHTGAPVVTGGCGAAP